MQDLFLNLQDSWYLMLDKVQSWIDGLVTHLPNFLLALVVVLVMFFASRFARKLIRKIVSRISNKESVNKLIANLAGSALIFLGFILVLNILELEETVTSLLAGAGIVGLVVGLAFQDAIANTFAGVVISVKDVFNIGDHVVIDGHEGIILQIGFRFTIVQTFDGQHAIIPNKTVISSSNLNYTGPKERRVVLECGVSYGENLEEVRDIARKAVSDIKTLDRTKGISFVYTGFGDSSIDFSIRFWLDPLPSHLQFLESRSEAIIRLKKAFDNAGISIPFPIRTLDFGIKGGNTLKEMLPK